MEPLGVSTGLGTGCDPGPSPVITPNSVRAASAPNPCTSWLIAESVGWVSRHSCEFQIVNSFGMSDSLWAPIVLYMGTDIVSIYI